jgi:hypothetical protein
MENNGQAESTKKSGSSSVKQCFSRSEAAYYLGVSVITIDRAVGGEEIGLLPNRSENCLQSNSLGRVPNEQ